MKIQMMKWIKDIFFEFRSITGIGIENTLSYFEKINPEFKRIKFKSGTKVFDWKVPKVWEINQAYIEHESGKKYCDIQSSNLHIINYSSKVNKIMTKKELLKKLYSIKSYPSAIPYITSYYKKSWGFCISENQKQKLPSGKYRAFIDSNFSNGYLNLSHALLKGKKKQEVFFSSYVCHPSMANNELSGPAVINGLLKYIKKFKNLKYTYRFVMLPETIGSISYLSKYHKEMTKNVICGFNLSCLGDNKAYSYINTPEENTLADYAIESALIGKKNVKRYSFKYRGSDERQYCSQNINLPVVTYCRSKFGEYKEYHTHKDNLSIISEKNLNQSLNVLIEIINVFENYLFPKTKIKCEPFYTKYNLYDTLSFKQNISNMAFRDIITYSNGKNSLFYISKKIGFSLNKTLSICMILKKKGLIFF